MSDTFFCYLLFTENLRQTYIGATVDPNRRLRQHNQELTGGARRTKGFVWQRALYVGGFPDWTATLQFEWSWKRHGRGLVGLAGKLRALLNLLHSEKSTSTATPFRYWPSQITIHPEPTSIQLLGKIEGFRMLMTECGRTISDILPFFSFQPFFPIFPNFPTMSVLSTSDIASLALQVEELSTTVAQLTARVDAALASLPKSKKTETATLPSTPDGEAKNEIVPGAPGAPKKEKKPRKPRAKKVEPMTSLETVADSTTDETVPGAPGAPKKEKKPRKPRAKKVEPMTSLETVADSTTDETPKKEKKPKAMCPASAEGVLRFNKSAGDAPLKELSNYFTSEFVLDGVTYRTLEAYLQSEKYSSTDPDYAQKIRDQRNSALLRGMAKSKGHTARADWDDVRLNVMRKGLEAKFAMPAFAAVLLGTGTALLEQESVDDAYWGIGADGTGENWTGKLLMELRTKLQATA